MQKRTPLSKGTVLDGRYRISRRLGSGGMGAVYEAEDTRLKNRAVAIKETFADSIETRRAFEREAELLANTAHDAFPCVIDYFTEGEGCFLVMELIRGDDLAGMLSSRSEPFTESEVLEWADQILDALEDLHAQGIVHRDIKPGNIKLTPRGRIKLLDFGIAKGNLSESAVTTVGSLAATLQYAPLEQVLRADANYHAVLSVNSSEKVEAILQAGTDARTDLYALGATLYQLLTKRLPKNAPTRAAAVWSAQEDVLIPINQINPAVSKEISEVLQKALEIEKNDRPLSAAEMRRLLLEARDSKNQERVRSGDASFISPEIKTIFHESIVKSENGRIEINLRKQKNEIAFSPKFQTIQEPRRTFLAMSSVLVIAFLIFGFWFFRIRTTPTVAASKDAVKQSQVNQNSERESKDRNSSQPKQVSGTKNPRRFLRTVKNEETGISTSNPNEIPANVSQTRPRRIKNSKSLEDLAFEEQKNEEDN
ncbi:MAG: serine/threonine protein kinase [Acidobacteriota bacterium]|nr:serine/threonine protein kinase [Acidobacteriota bacterium]